MRSFHRPFRACSYIGQRSTKSKHVRRHGKTGRDGRVIPKRLHRRAFTRQGIVILHPDVTPIQLGRFENVIQHADVWTALLHCHRLALQVGHRLDALAGNHVVTGRPSHLHDHHALGAGVGPEHLRRLPHHTVGAAEEGRFAGAVIPHLLDEIITRCQVQVEPLFLKKAAGLRF